MVADLPVGQSLEDHIFTDAGQFTIQKPISFTEKKMESLTTKLQYTLFRTGKQIVCNKITLVWFNH